MNRYKLCIFDVVPRTGTKKATQKEILKNTVNKNGIPTGRQKKKTG